MATFINLLADANNGGNLPAAHLLEVLPTQGVGVTLKAAYGTGTLVTGAVTVDTGLNTVVSFQACLIGTGAGATGATEVEDIRVASITTGAVACVGSYHSATAAVSVISASGTASFRWIALGT